jgi:hypothetical protein
VRRFQTGFCLRDGKRGVEQSPEAEFIWTPPTKNARHMKRAIMSNA